LSFLKELKSWLGLDTDSVTPESAVNQANPLFVYIKLPVDLQPLERGELFEDPLQEALERESLGTVTGGGSQLSDLDEDGRRQIEFCGIDVDLYDPQKGLVLLRSELIRLKAPPGTLLLYELNGHEWEEPIYDTNIH
jgi:hypothetical protein